MLDGDGSGRGPDVGIACRFVVEVVVAAADGAAIAVSAAVAPANGAVRLIEWKKCLNNFSKISP